MLEFQNFCDYILLESISVFFQFVNLIENTFLHLQVNFLSQIRLTHNGDGPNVAKRLIDVYFALFKV